MVQRLEIIAADGDGFILNPIVGVSSQNAKISKHKSISYNTYCNTGKFA